MTARKRLLLLGILALSCPGCGDPGPGSSPDLAADPGVAAEDASDEEGGGAPGPVGPFEVDPLPVDFGVVRGGQQKDLEVRVRNPGPDPATLLDLWIDFAGASADFQVVSVEGPGGSGLPATLQGGEDLRLVLRYQPRGWDCDHSRLVLDQDTPDGPVQLPVDLHGCEFSPRCAVSPGQVDFGWVPANGSAVATITVRNQGNDDLVVPPDGLKLTPGSDPEIRVQDAPAGELRIPPDGEASLTLAWTARTAAVDPSLPIGGLSIASNDPESPMTVPVFGRLDAPCAEVFPNPVDFDLGAMNVPVQRLLTLSNPCHGDLVVTGLEIQSPSNPELGDEFAIVPDAAFPPTTGTEATIEGGGSRGVTLTFTNKGPDTGAATATLVVRTSQPGKETIQVPLSAKRTGTAACRLSVIPTSIAFGMQAIGTVTEKQMNVVNTGTGPCTINGLSAADCTIDPMGKSTCFAPLKGTPSTVFSVLNAPPAGTSLQAGQAWIMKVAFAPPAPGSSSLPGQSDNFAGLLGIRYTDDLSKMVGEFPKGTTSGSTTIYAANLGGQAGTARAFLLPAEIVHRKTTVGCNSSLASACVHVGGKAPLQFKGVRLEDCSPEFQLANVPTLPKPLIQGAAVCFGTRYTPQDAGQDRCHVIVETTDPATPILRAPLSGEGTYDTQVSDGFTQASGQAVDILFVVDDSGSMCEHQEKLIKSFGTFLAQAGVWQNDYHLGVITVNVVDPLVMGRLNKGLTTPTFVTPGMSDAQALFLHYVEVGCDGQSDAREAGLEATLAALSAPLVSDTGVSCTGDDACTNNPVVCPDPATCPSRCMDGVCGGWNRGFLRDDARLELVILSDEEDQSGGSVVYYVDFLRGLKGALNPQMMHVNAIVWDDDQCKGQSSQATGKRYIQAAQQTGGQVGLLCLDDYGPVLAQIGAQAFTPKLQFFLSRTADPPTVKVRVDSTACTGTWTFDNGSNSVVFDGKDAANPCSLPKAGSKISITYDGLCLKS